jgi:hypothetical protein
LAVAGKARIPAVNNKNISTPSQPRVTRSIESGDTRLRPSTRTASRGDIVSMSVAVVPSTASLTIICSNSVPRGASNSANNKAKTAANLSPNDEVFAVLFMLPR